MATSQPLMNPHSAPVNIPPAMPNGIGRPQNVMTTPVITEAKVITVPTDKSIPPVIMTKVEPSASTPITAVDSIMPIRLSNRKKFSEDNEKNTINKIRLAKASSFCVAPVFNETGFLTSASFILLPPPLAS
ncbi:hypothetical protein D3C78_1159780 [compost metagenome]